MQIPQPQNIPKTTDEFWIWILMPTTILFIIISIFCLYMAYLESKGMEQYKNLDQ